MKEHMDEFWKPVADPSPDVLARQLTFLRYWLSRPAWTPNQAACLLAGVCPIDNFLTDIAFAAYLPVAEVDAYLPGRQEWEHSPEIGKKITEGRIAQIETSLVQSFSREHMTPKDFIGLGIRFGFRPPWLEYALKSQAAGKPFAGTPSHANRPSHCARQGRVLRSMAGGGRRSRARACAGT